MSIQYVSDAPYTAGASGLASDNSDGFYGAGAGAAIASIDVFRLAASGAREAVTASTEFPLGSNTVYYVAQDLAGNEVECSHTVLVSDDQAPILGTAGDCSAFDVAHKVTDAGHRYGTYGSLDSIAPTVTDNSLLSITLVPSVGGTDIDASYQFDYAAPTTVLWTATDEAGNAATCTTTVTVVDNEAPVLGNGGDCSAWDVTVPASFDATWFASCSFNGATGQMDCADTTVDPHGLPPVYGRALLPDIPVADNSGEALTTLSTIEATGANAAGVHACVGCTESSSVYTADAMPAGHEIPHLVLFDAYATAGPRASQASETYTITYTVQDGSSNAGTCTIDVTVVEEDDCVAANARCGAHSVACIDLAATSWGLHESAANRIYYDSETFLGTIDRGDGSPSVLFSTEAEWRGYYNSYSGSPLHENARPGYQCVCEHGWEGDDCRTDTDECQAGTFLCTANEPCNGPCENAAPCKDSTDALGAGEDPIAANAYRCDCDFGFSGINCDIYNECASDPCYQLTTSPPTSVTATDTFLCPVAMTCNDPDFTTTDDYTYTCPDCNEAMFSSANVAALGDYLGTHPGLRSFVDSRLAEQSQEEDGTQSVCQMTSEACQFGPTGVCPAGCTHVSGVSCTGRRGCTDAAALNYDATASEDDGSCIAVVYGCMDPTAANYDASATAYDPTGVQGAQCRKTGYSTQDECATGNPCSSPETRLCPMLAGRGMTPDSCSQDRHAFVCPDAAPSTEFACHDPNHDWPGDFTCQCAFAEEDGFYDAAASSSCGEAVVYGSVTNYALTRLADSVASLRTRLCDVLGSVAGGTAPDDCFLGYLTVSGRRRT